MFRKSLAGLLLGMLWTAFCPAEIIVTAGDIALLPNQANQKVAIEVSETQGEVIQGLNFRIRVGNGTGGPDYSHPGPTITAVDLTDESAIFSLNHQDLTNVKRYPYSWAGSVTTAAGTVVPEGILAYVTFDTTSVNSTIFTGPWDLLFLDRSGNKTNFAGIVPTLVAGTIEIKSVPEPAPCVLMAGACLAFAIALLRKRLARQWMQRHNAGCY